MASASEGALAGLAQELGQCEVSVVLATDGLKAFDVARAGGVELIVLAEPLGAVAGQGLCTALREANVTVPILLLDTPDRVVAGLVAGADVVLPLESSAELLLAQTQSLLRRVSLERSPLRMGDLALDTTTRRATRGGTQIALSATEFTLLELLLRRAGRVVTREEIMEHVWPGEERATDNVLDVYVSYLRTKIDRNFAVPLIRTVRGQGYTIVAD
jgi:two-component system OmpR family response regulator